MNALVLAPRRARGWFSIRALLVGFLVLLETDPTPALRPTLFPRIELKPVLPGTPLSVGELIHLAAVKLLSCGKRGARRRRLRDDIERFGEFVCRGWVDHAKVKTSSWIAYSSSSVMPGHISEVLSSSAVMMLFTIFSKPS